MSITTPSGLTGSKMLPAKTSQRSFITFINSQVTHRSASRQTAANETLEGGEVNHGLEPKGRTSTGGEDGLWQTTSMSTGATMRACQRTRVF